MHDRRESRDKILMAYEMHYLLQLCEMESITTSPACFAAFVFSQFAILVDPMTSQLSLVEGSPSLLSPLPVKQFES